jgi:hypothetical protein
VPPQPGANGLGPDAMLVGPSVNGAPCAGAAPTTTAATAERMRNLPMWTSECGVASNAPRCAVGRDPAPAQAAMAARGLAWQET